MNVKIHLFVFSDVTAPVIDCPDPITEFAEPRNDFVVSSFPWEPLQVNESQCMKFCTLKNDTAKYSFTRISLIVSVGK